MEKNELLSNRMCFNGMQYRIDSEKVIAITEYVGHEINVVVPKTINGIPVTMIKYGAFREGTNIESIILHDGIEYIGDDAFKNCKSLKSIVMPSSIKSTWKQFRSTFKGCINLEKLNIPEGVTCIGDHAFEECSNLKSIVIPSSVEYISEYAFCDCVGLERIIIPESVKEIGKWTFKNCVSLHEVRIEGNTTKYCSTSFENCASLERINYGESIIKSGISFTSDNLTIRDGILVDAKTTNENIVIPNNVVAIGESAFENNDIIY